MSFWHLLGIEPTRDLILIKRAYAARLKQTRPDDDREAYQALRTAYDWAQQYALSVQNKTSAGPMAGESTADPDLTKPLTPARPSNPSGPQSTSAVHADEPAPQESHPQPPAYVSPRDLAHETLNYLQVAGPDALVAGWPNLQRELDKLPLWERSDACNWFAQLVIDTSQMPPAFAGALAQYFSWETDFRTEQMLGMPRAMALRERLGRLQSDFYADDAFRHHYREISFYGQLVGRIAEWQLYLFALLAPSRFVRLWDELAPRQRYALGVPKPPLHSIAENALEFAAMVRLILTVIFAALVMQLPSLSALPLPARFLAAVLFGIGGFIFSGFAYRAFLRVKKSLHTFLRPDRLDAGLPKPEWLAIVGVTSLLLATIVCGITETNTWTLVFRADFAKPVLACVTTLLVVVAAFTPSLPTTDASGALPAILGFCVVTVMGLPGLDDLPWTAACAGAAWFMACCVVHALYGNAIERRWHLLCEAEHQRRATKGRRTLRNLLFILSSFLRLTLGWPYRLMILATEQSARTVIAVVCLSLIALPPSYREWQLPFTAGMVALLNGLGRLYFDNALIALVPGQRLPAWRGWLGMVMMTMAIVWAAVYWSAEPWIYEVFGWQPAMNATDAFIVKFALTFAVPLILVLANQKVFTLVKVQPRQVVQ